jgi:hypothetical protein
MGIIHPVNFKVISQSIQKLLSRNNIQNGCHGGHIEKTAMMIFKINLPLDTPCNRSFSPPLDPPLIMSGRVVNHVSCVLKVPKLFVGENIFIFDI